MQLDQIKVNVKDIEVLEGVQIKALVKGLEQKPKQRQERTWGV